MTDSNESRRLADAVSAILMSGFVPYSPMLQELRTPRPAVTLAWLANRVYGDRARVARCGMEPVKSPYPAPRLRIDLLDLRGPGQRRLVRFVPREEIVQSKVDIVWLHLSAMHAQLEHDLGLSASWAEFIVSRPVQAVRGSPYVHDGLPDETFARLSDGGSAAGELPRRCFTFKPDLLCACGAFIVAWDGKLPA